VAKLIADYEDMIQPLYAEKENQSESE
jgi:hypothetical protein